MKKMTAILTGAALLLSPAGMLPMQASAVTVYVPYLLGEDGVCYSNEPYVLGVAEDVVPNPGVVTLSYELGNALAANPEGTFAVDVESYAWALDNGYFSESLKEFNETHTVGGMTYAEFWEKWYAADKESDQDTLDALKGDLPEIQNATAEYEKELTEQIHEEEKALLTESYGLVSGDALWYLSYSEGCVIVTGEQLRSFTGHAKCGYHLGIAPAPAHGQHTIEDVPRDAETAEAWVSRYDVTCTDGVWYSGQPGGEFEFEPYEANRGTYDRSALLNALLMLHPGDSFAVQIDVQGASPEDMLSWFAAHGVEAALMSSRRLTAVVTGEQLADFPSPSNVGLFIGLAGDTEMQEEYGTTDAPDLPQYGDATNDGSIDIMDVVCINKFLIGGISLTDEQKRCADCDRDGTIDHTDSLNVLKYVIGLIGSLSDADAL